MARKEPFLTIDFGKDGGQRSFSDPSELLSFISSERDEWTWLAEHVIKGGLYSEVYSEIENSINDILYYVPNATNGNSIDTGSVRSAITSLFVNRLPIKGSKRAIVVSKIKNEHGPEVAVAALAAYMKKNIGNIPAEYIRGAMLAMSIELGINTKAAQASSDAMSMWIDRFANEHGKAEKQNARIVERLDDINIEWAAAERKRARRLQAQCRLHSRQFRRQTVARAAEADAAIARIDAVKSAYEEQMRLQAPVAYWESKQQGHKEQAARRAAQLMRFAGIAGFVIVIAFVGFALNAPTLIKNASLPVFGVWSALGIFITSIAFWAGRVLTRLYLSELHLGIDAAERATMAKTYLALTATGNVSEEQRALVLAGLFRSTSDGIVRDDAAPDLGLASFVSRLGSRTP